MNADNDTAERLAQVLVERRSAVTALRAGPLSRSDLETAVGVSRTTAHRILSEFEDLGLVVGNDGTYALTELGELLADEVAAFERTVAAVDRLAPLLETVRPLGLTIDPAVFEDAAVTRPQQGSPYGHLAEVSELLETNEVVRGFDAGTVASTVAVDPTVLEGTDVELLCTPAAAEGTCPHTPAGETTMIHEDLPFGLLLFDDRVWIADHDPNTGMARLVVESEATEAIEWATQVFETYRQEAEPVQQDAEGSTANPGEAD